MINYIVRRLLILPLILFGVTLLVFGMLMMLGPYQRVATYVQDPTQLKGGDLDLLINKYSNTEKNFKPLSKNPLGDAQYNNLFK